MTRIKRGILAQKKHKKLKKSVKGFRTTRRKSVKLARQALMKSMSYAYHDRKKKKTVMRSLWIVRINAALQPMGLSYGKFMNQLKLNKVEVDRKILAQLAHQHPEAFSALVAKLK
ncbi:50S ribosomal protein L20 [candidate division Kazan bacterium RIFCSPLOWO2_01_FULL_48_13]|uniref:Large ribosomal subunit protein bL20 n=1 Tax=candidate division Kazan bacterium RIFCSPLOWO2_01_FULL_48_13 TaxID=1798539 RepID=A0A1F4PQ21_UNCK3|nr:MAG: 50S ribosomal protein L20 [candidate division Kazan bacterium RIFCSPLOWO2_01_FULL_48_13]